MAEFALTAVYQLACPSPLDAGCVFLTSSYIVCHSDDIDDCGNTNEHSVTGGRQHAGYVHPYLLLFFHSFLRSHSSQEAVASLVVTGDVFPYPLDATVLGRSEDCVDPRLYCLRSVPDSDASDVHVSLRQIHSIAAWMATTSNPLTSRLIHCSQH